MAAPILYRRCLNAVPRAFRISPIPLAPSIQQTRALSRPSSSAAAPDTTTSPSQETSILSKTPSSEENESIDSILPPPTFSVRSLLPSPSAPADPIITPQKLQHLLHLSALPPPSSPEEEAKMLKDLNDQLHFVRAIQSVDTSGVEPCVGITRDQALLTEEGMEGLTLEDLERAEEEEGRLGDMGDVQWDPVSLAKEKVGKYYVVPGEEGED